MELAQRKEVAAKYGDYCEEWYRMYLRYIYGHYCLSLIAIILTAILTVTKGSGHNSLTTVVLGVILVVDTASIGLFKAERTANQAQRAWRILDAELTRYLYDSGDIKDLMAAHAAGEDILHETQTGPTRPNRPHPLESSASALQS